MNFYNKSCDIFEFSAEELRQILSGKFNSFECLYCNGTGWENWNEEGDDLKPGKSVSKDRVTGRCEECHGLGCNFKLDGNV